MVDITAIFPSARRVSQPKGKDEKNYLALPDGHWIEIDKGELTAREEALLSLFTPAIPPKTSSPWAEYLVWEKGTVPKSVKKIQFLHVRTWKQTSDDWLDMMAELLPNTLGRFQFPDGNLIFVLDQEQGLAIYDILSESIQALEIDFDVRLTCFLGQIWQEADQKAWPSLFQAEQQLFARWQESYNQTTVLTFSKLFLWGQTKGEFSPVLANHLRNLILEQDQLTEIILALWEESAVATKAAQKLYLHRNTLQYRLEKWHELTGLQLKELTDLTLCYSLVLDDLF
ncbi:Leucine-rich protein [Chlamydia trachomatis]|nr:Leucine-rich protein [Chlamydia trachomatis]